MSDENERSVASDGSVEPVAWAVVSDSTGQIDCEFVYPDEATAGDVALDINGGVVPLYSSHQLLTLTADERTAIQWVLGEVKVDDRVSVEATLRQLLARCAGSASTEGAVPSEARCQPNWSEIPTWADVLVAVSGDMRDEIAALRAQINRLRLTAAERQTILYAIDAIRDRFEGYGDCETLQSTLRALLERTR